MARKLLPDTLWAEIEPLLPKEPPKPKGGRPPLPNRGALTDILFVLKSGIPWKMLPQEMGCGSGMTCWRGLRDWHQAGVWHLGQAQAAVRKPLVQQCGACAPGAGLQEARSRPKQKSGRNASNSLAPPAIPQSTKRYLIRAQTAWTPSVQRIFFPSEALRAR